MSGRLLFALAIIVVGVFKVPALATSYIPPDYKCPLGGQVFQGSFGAEIRRKVLQEEGDLLVDPRVALPIEQCPNGFLISQANFSADELEHRARLIADPEFHNLRDRPTYEQLWWLRMSEGASPLELARLRYLAARELGPRDPMRLAELSAHYFKAVAALPLDAKQKTAWARENLRAANLMRELSLFVEAETLLAVIESPELGLSGDKVVSELKILKQLTREKNSAWLPITLVSPQSASRECISPSRTLSLSERERCETPEVRAAMREECNRREARLGRSQVDQACHQFSLSGDLINFAALALAFFLLVATFRNLRRA